MSPIKSKEEEDEELLHKVAVHAHEVLQGTPVHSSKDINIHQVDDPKRMSDHISQQDMQDESGDEDLLRTIEENDQEQDADPLKDAFKEETLLLGDQALPQTQDRPAVEEEKKEANDSERENNEETKRDERNNEKDHEEKQIEEVTDELAGVENPNKVEGEEPREIKTEENSKNKEDIKNEENNKEEANL